jgi:hypothetical protein
MGQDLSRCRPVLRLLPARPARFALRPAQPVPLPARFTRFAFRPPGSAAAAS